MQTVASLADRLDMSAEAAVEKLRYMLFDVEGVETTLSDEEVDLLIDVDEDPSVADRIREAKLKDREKLRKKEERKQKATTKAPAKAQSRILQDGREGSRLGGAAGRRSFEFKRKPKRRKPSRPKKMPCHRSLCLPKNLPSRQSQRRNPSRLRLTHALKSCLRNRSKKPHPLPQSRLAAPSNMPRAWWKLSARTAPWLTCRIL